MVTADKLILEWVTFLTCFDDLWETETEAMQVSTRGADGGSSWLGTIGAKMQGPTAGFEHATQPDGSLLAEQ